MSTPHDLPHRAVACRHWRWLPGMITTEGERVVYVETAANGVPLPGAWTIRANGRDRVSVFGPADRLPDLADPATIGCLLRLVREAWDDRGLHVVPLWWGDGHMWHVRGGHHHGRAFRVMAGVGHPTEAAALIAALEATP